MSEKELNSTAESKDPHSKIEFTKKMSFLDKWFAPMKNKGPRKDNKFFGFMQQLGGTFMLPISVLSVAGLFLGVGSGFETIVTKDVSEVGYDILDFISLIGTFFFDVLPVAFCLAIPIGLASDNKGVAAFSAFLAYVAVEASIAWFLRILPPDFKDMILNSGGLKAEDIGVLKNVLGYQGMDLNILGAIIIGLTVWKLHERFQYQKLPTGIAFFAGKRLTPVLCLLIYTVGGIILTLVWPWVCRALYYFGQGVHYLGVFGPGVFIFVSRLLCPTGLHHMLNALFNYTPVGGQYLIDGNWVSGNQYAMIAALKDTIQLDPNIARWLTGGYILPISFGLPAAAFAMYFASYKENRNMVKGLIISGIIATWFGGITETIEFLFLFVCPWLYIFHAFMVGVGYVVWAAFYTGVGVGGDGISFIIYGPLQGLYTKWWLVFPTGVVDAIIYYCVFYFSIKHFDIKTPGRTDSSNIKMGAILDTGARDVDRKSKKDKKNKKINGESVMAQKLLDLLGGWANIAHLDNCFSRLRVSLTQPREITDEAVKDVGCVGLKKISDVSYQIVVGIKVEEIKREMILLKNKPAIPIIDNTPQSSASNNLNTNDLPPTINKKNKKIKKTTAEMIMAQKLLDMMGGWDNIAHLDNCFSRLRISLIQPREITDEAVKDVGCVGLKKISDVSYQIVVGIKVEEIKREIILLKNKQ